MNNKPSYNLDELISQNKLVMTKTAENQFKEYMEKFGVDNMKDLEKEMINHINNVLELDYNWDKVYTGTLLEGMLKEKIIKMKYLVASWYVRNSLTEYVF